MQEMSRREILKVLATVGVGNVVFQRALAAEVAKQEGLSLRALQDAEWVSGVVLREEEREQLRKALEDQLEGRRRLHAHATSCQSAPALRLSARSRDQEAAKAPTVPAVSARLVRPRDDAALAFLSVVELGALLRRGEVTSVALTEIYLRRLKLYDPQLLCIVHLTEALAREQAERADAELAAGEDRGPLHGIPWGAKDLMAVPGYPTTWGAPQYRERVLEEKATAVERLEAAGAVLVAKLSLGALAMGDRWYRGMTRNPWDLQQGSSGSSAGSASATAAGLVGFAIGSETLGSIVSPCRRCGVTGLRPTFGRVSRHGCMALSWSMDKIGPIARTATDAALILEAIQGPDQHDHTVFDERFARRPLGDPGSLRLGYVPGEEGIPLELFGKLGFELVPVTMPEGYPVWDMTQILTAEAATAFHDWTVEGITEGLGQWPRIFRKGHFVTAVDYLRANQLRDHLMDAFESIFEKVDVLLGGGRDELAMSNLTGHPSIIVPSGFATDKSSGKRRPQALKMTGRWRGETALIHVAEAYQQATAHHVERPPGFL